MTSRPRFGRRGLRWHFEHNDGHLIHKWDHYFEIYERHFDAFRGRAPRVLEIGVFHGGSLQMWRHYFGRRAVIVGIDRDPRTAKLAEPGIDVYVGDQTDPDFLMGLVDRYGGFDIVIDDGSHRPAHQTASLDILWPHVAEGGIYLVEDLHTNYWPHYDGARGRPDTFVEHVKNRIDDLHAFHSREDDFRPTNWTTTLAGLHVYDSIVVLDKQHRKPPTDRRTGWPAFDTTFGRPSDELIDETHRLQLESLGRPSARLRRLVRDPVTTTRRVLGRWRDRS